MDDIKTKIQNLPRPSIEATSERQESEMIDPITYGKERESSRK